MRTRTIGSLCTGTRDGLLAGLLPSERRLGAGFGSGPLTGHDAMVSGAGFGRTIRAINGLLECDGGNPRQVKSRIDLYEKYTKILGVPTGPHLSC